MNEEEVVADWKPRAPLDGRLRVQPSGMCGGARVPDNYRPPPLAPAGGIALRVMAAEVYGDEHLVATVTTDAEGKFVSKQLSNGTYCIARDHGAKPTQAGQYTDLECLVKRWESCDAVVTVPVTKPVLIDIREQCAWSICYHGPPPP